jgi:hypothetical protein
MRIRGANFGGFSDGSPSSVAVDQSSGDVYVIDVAAQPVRRFDSTGAPKDFAALGSNVLDGAGAGDCGGTPADCDGSPAGGLAFESADNGGGSQVAVDRSGGPTDGDVYVTDTYHGVVDVFDNLACGVAVDAGGSVYVADRDQSLIQSVVR